MRQFLLVVTVLAASAAWPTVSGAGTFTGVVVAKEGATLLVAHPGGTVGAVRGSAFVGARVRVAGGSLRVVGRTSRAVVQGVVVGRTASTMFLAAGRHVLAVRTARQTAATPAPVPLVPQPGHKISATLHISGGGGLDDEGDDDLGPAPAVTVQATVAAVASGFVTLTVNGQTLTVPLPQGLTLPAAVVGQTVTLQLSFPGSTGGGTGGGDDDGGGDDGGGDG